ncbi:helicase associated domain-containing protein [Streptomyces sp. ISL-98]|uniref:helicase associated domain-containing protein n=1 Tax=Streptomyces sp. ISL-98 TaxID=2819192 RepID=UPI0027E4771A|nr:helicase associated domain-containing protein [Streptomyces sp. ISL-98]
MTKLGVTPAEQQSPDPEAKSSRTAAEKTSTAFQRGVAALGQYIAREGHHCIPRGHAEEITVQGQAAPAAVKLGVRISNTKTRRNKLTQEQRAQLTELRVDWAR